MLASLCYNQNGELVDQKATLINTEVSSFTLSEKDNRLLLIGCSDVAMGSGYLFYEGTNFSTGCMTRCSSGKDVSNSGNCSGIGCCQAAIPKGLTFFSGLVIGNHTAVWSFNPCSYAFLGEHKKFKFRGASDFMDPNFERRIVNDVPIVLDWAIGTQNCSEILMSAQTILVMELAQTLHEGFSVPVRRDTLATARKDILKLSLGLGLGLLSLLVSVTWIFLDLKRRKILKSREKFFKQNGGMLLKQQMSSNLNKVFTIEELKKATNNFAKDRILGVGGNGVVYKGVLPYQRIVAIKKSKQLEQNQIEEFINEVVILTQINHKNVLKLLGCFLETEVPLLVYEYISHGTLHHHIQTKNGEMPWLSFQNRLRIAIESADAFSYLHSATSIPILHRDIKSANILLDDYYTIKIADFGASRLTPFDQADMSSLIPGTLGYLDPKVVKENRLFEILHHRVLKEGSLDQLNAIGELVVRCLNTKGEERPTMREVTNELEGFTKYIFHSWAHHDQENNQPQMEEMIRERNDLYTVRMHTSTNCDIPSSVQQISEYSVRCEEDPLFDN
ncbi:wall-associated receptor kinase 4 [Capsicum chacoense]